MVDKAPIFYKICFSMIIDAHTFQIFSCSRQKPNKSPQTFEMEYGFPRLTYDKNTLANLLLGKSQLELLDGSKDNKNQG